jgi:hypothetical protein
MLPSVRCVSRPREYPILSRYACAVRFKRVSCFAAGVVLACSLSWCVHGPRLTLAQPAPAPETAEAPPVRDATAMAAVAADVVRGMGPAPSDPMVIASPLVSDAKAPRGPDLALALARLVAGRIGAGATASPELADLSGARTLGRNRRSFVHLTVEIARGQLRVTSDLYPVPGTVWARARAPEPGPIAHAFAQAPIDAEVRTFLEPIPLSSQLDVSRARNFESGVLALACDDVDEDGAPEVLSVSRVRVTLLRIRDGKVVPVRSRPWSELSEVHPAPLREPIGFATIIPPSRATVRGRAELVASSTDRAKSVRLDRELELIDDFAGMALPDGDGIKCAGLLSLAVTGPVSRCAAADPEPLTASVGGRYDAFDSERLATPDGKSYVVWVGREDRVLEMRDDQGRVVRGNPVGAQLAVGDLNQDGRPEVISGLDVLDALKDAVVVQTLLPQGKRFEERARLPAGAGVRALALCPPDGAGRSPFVVATSDEIWVVR